MKASAFLLPIGLVSAAALEGRVPQDRDAQIKSLQDHKIKVENGLRTFADAISRANPDACCPATPCFVGCFTGGNWAVSFYKSE